MTEHRLFASALYFACALGAACLSSTNALAIDVTFGPTLFPGLVGPHTIPLGPFGTANTQSCFLSGLFGDFRGLPGLDPSGPTSGPTQPVMASVTVTIENGNWVLQTASGNGTGVGALVTCIKPAAKRSGLQVSDNSANSQTDLNADANTHCFLTRVWATTGLSAEKLNGVIPNITVKQDTLTDTLTPLAGNFGYGGGSAQCVDYVETGGWEYGIVSTRNPAPLSVSVAQFTLRSTPAKGQKTGTPISTSGVACFLTSVGGNWAGPVPDLLGPADGVYPSANTVTKEWTLTATNGRQGAIHCSL